MSFAQVTLLGRLGADPEAKEVGEAKLAVFSVATNRKVKGTDVTTWHRVNAWNKLGEIAYNYLQKGSQVLVVGELSSRKVEDKVYWDVTAKEIKFVGGREAQGSEVPNAAPPSLGEPNFS